MSNLTEESLPMRVARRFGMDKIAWAMRRFHCPVAKHALVLEVGSGGNPYARANVLLDAYEHTQERHWAPLVADRPTVLAFVENLPFRDRAFDFVIASHVLEHSTRPERFLAELQRVAHCGYIEVPDAFMERVNPYHDHRLEISVREGRLIVRKKAAWRSDPQLVELYEHRAKRWMTRELMPRRPFAFHVRYYWSEQIDFEVVNPGVDAGWPAPSESMSLSNVQGGLDPRGWARRAARALLSQHRRNRQIDLCSLLRCPTCHQSEFQRSQAALSCRSCGAVFALSRGIPRMVAVSE
jgi:SAM-dependent methyltransferase